MILIFGKRGSGKTLLLVDFAINKMLNGLWDCFDSHSQVNQYNSMGFNFSKKYNHLAFANIDINCSGTYIPFRRINSFNPFRFGFKSNDYKTFILPPNSLLCITEAQRVFNSNMAMFFRAEFLSAIETSRHYDIDFILDCQRPKLILPSVRELVDTFICVKGVKHIKDLKGNVICHEWSLIEFEDWSNVERYLSTGDLSGRKQKTYRNNRCLFSNYDTTFCKWLHLQGRKEEDFYLHKFPYISSLEEVEKFNDNYGLSVPNGFYVKRSGSAVSNSSSIEEII